ncbi:MAG: hypothetical protein K0S08_1565 [Gammaproteobacteria bacterium]|jgi:hypothetical protein|nr:hypothetical protein [Gammaproteobacteria bacterium]
MTKNTNVEPVQLREVEIASKFWTVRKDKEVYAKQYIERTLHKYGLTLNDTELNSLKPKEIKWSDLEGKLKIWDEGQLEGLNYLSKELEGAILAGDAFMLIGILIYLKRDNHVIDINYPLEDIDNSHLYPIAYAKTPLGIATERKYALCVKILLQCPGIDINQGIVGMRCEEIYSEMNVSPFRIATGNEDNACVKLLEDAGANKQGCPWSHDNSNKVSCVLL